MRWMLPVDTLHLPLYPSGSSEGPVLPEEGMHPPSPSRPRAGHVPSSRRSPLRRGCPPPSRRLRPSPPWLPWLPWHLAPPARRRATSPPRSGPSTSVRVRCPWGMYALKPVRRGGMMNSRPLARLCHSCVRKKVVFIPLLIPQPDWNKYHFFPGLSHI